MSLSATYIHFTFYFFVNLNFLVSKQPPTTSTKSFSTTTTSTASGVVTKSVESGGNATPQDGIRRSSIPMPISSVVSAISSSVIPKPNNAQSNIPGKI